ncbi:MAG: hypothetical protein M0Q37_06320 [Sphaerochaeta sp.]|jgi:4-diphosphocytidyl-2-C-methyl-D-erythritol kinase|nr:hypothetical protein [Sphaerochaeta sp.]
MNRTALAHAKINLHLAVGPLREDGFHDIQSLFVRLALADVLHIHWQTGPFGITVTGLDEYCAPGSDTLSRAAHLWHEATGCDVVLTVQVEKHIPVQSGLGGGSSDAAALLAVLNTIADAGDERLRAIASAVGSDVPFFLCGVDAAVVEGRGEVVRPIVSRPLPVLLAMPKALAVSTAQAYATLDHLRTGMIHPFSRFEEIVTNYDKSCPTWSGSLYNDFYATVAHEPIYAALDGLCADLDGYASISGSGSCWYFVSEDEGCVKEVGERVQHSLGDQVVVWQSRLL